MANSTKTLKTRVQLKSDTESNWKKSVLVADGGEKVSGTSFVPLLGELIVYTSDDTHPFSRLKIGDGNTNVVKLPFIDAGTISGDTLPESEIITYAARNLFPSPGQENKLYIDLDTNTIYCYTNAGGYSKLSNFTYTIEKVGVSNITYWRAGSITSLSCSEGILSVSNGRTPALNYDPIQVVRNVTKEGVE